MPREARGAGHPLPVTCQSQRFYSIITVLYKYLKFFFAFTFLYNNEIVKSMSCYYKLEKKR